MNNGNSRKVKSVRFNQEAQVLLFETPHSDNDNSASMPMRSARPKPCSVRGRASTNDERVSRCSAPQQPRPPALPPRNAVQVPPVNRAETQKPSPPKPPPRAKNNSTASRPKVRIFRRDPNAQPVTEGLSGRGESSAMLGREDAPAILHSSRMKVPDTPPPPPPLAPLAPLSPSAPSTSSALSEPSADGGGDDGTCRADRKRPDTSQERADGTDADDDDDRDRDDRPAGCTAGCILFIVFVIGCIIG